jgi:hypothetical protein
VKIRIATLGWQGARAARYREDVAVGIGPQWVELDGVRTTDVIGAKVEVAEGDGTVVTLTIAAAAEMILVDADGKELV